MSLSRTIRRRPGATLPLGLVGLAAALAMGVSPVVARSPAAEGLRLVGIGDSILTTNGCPGCTPFLDQHAAGLGRALGTSVSATNLAIPGAVVAQVLDQVRTDPAAREAIAGADILVVTVGFDDVPFGRGDDPCGVETAFPVVEWTGLTVECMDRVVGEYARDLDALLAQTRALRAGAPTLTRVTTVYNAVLGDSVDPGWDSPEAVLPSIYSIDALEDAACSVAAVKHAVCVDTYHALNGSTGVERASGFLAPDHTHLGALGHELFAAALLASGVAPFE